MYSVLRWRAAQHEGGVWCLSPSGRRPDSLPPVFGAFPHTLPLLQVSHPLLTSSIIVLFGVDSQWHNVFPEAWQFLISVSMHHKFLLSTHFLWIPVCGTIDQQYAFRMCAYGDHYPANGDWWIVNGQAQHGILYNVYCKRSSMIFKNVTRDSDDKWNRCKSKWWSLVALIFLNAFCVINWQIFTSVTVPLWSQVLEVTSYWLIVTLYTTEKSLTHPQYPCVC